MKLTTGKYYHYRVYVGKTLVVDGHGNYNRVRDIYQVLDHGKLPTQKSQNNMLWLAIRDKDYKIEAFEFDTKAEAKAAEDASHDEWGKPTSAEKDVYIQAWLDTLDVPSELEAILLVLRINQDTLINSYLTRIYQHYPELEGFLNDPKER